MKIKKLSKSIRQYKNLKKLLPTLALVILLPVIIYKLSLAEEKRIQDRAKINEDEKQIQQAPQEKNYTSLTLTNTSWISNKFYGEIVNYGNADAFNSTIKISVSKDPVNWIPEEQFITIPYRIKAGETIKFLETVNTPKQHVWWASYITNAKYYNGENVPSPPAIPQNTSPQYYQPTNSANNSNANDPWGVAKQIDDVTWTMKIGYDDRMASPKEIFEALNIYRNRYGIHSLQWDDKLAAYAQSRADYFASIESTDKHAGFKEYTSNYDNLKTLEAFTVGENCSYGFRLSGVHIIEWQYAGDEPHNKNQLNSKWNKVGIGVNGTATDLIFGS